MRVAVVCPTRGRPDMFIKMMDTFLSTSTHADMLAYIDEDQERLYRDCLGDLSERFGGRLHLHVDSQVGPALSCERLIEQRRTYDIYGLMTDDSEFLSKGWDDYLVRTFESFPNRIGVVSPHHGIGPWVNFPYVSRRWLDVVGWYVHPGMQRFCWDTVLEILGEATRIEYPTRGEFGLVHHGLMAEGTPSVNRDAHEFLNWCIVERRAIVEKVRAAMRS